MFSEPDSKVESVIEVVNLGKRYQVYKKPYHRLLAGLGMTSYRDEFVALKGVNLSVRKGESIGILGANGAGKSTLLQLICGTLHPSEGEITTSGRISALLELGAGFSPEFTGRENARIFSSLQGVSSGELEEKLEAIHEFSEIGDHFDQPMRSYSSGMFMRLAFAASILSEPDVLIVDEALSVGDIYFQLKCERKIKEFQASGGTFIFVTHSTNSIINLCDSAIVMGQGEVLFNGPAKAAVDFYLKHMFGGKAPEVSISGDGSPLSGLEGDLFHTRPGYNPNELRFGRGGARVSDFYFHGLEGVPNLPSGDTARFSVRYEFEVSFDRLVFGMMLRDQEGLLVYACNSLYADNQLYSFNAGQSVQVAFTFEANLIPRNYFVTFGVSTASDHSAEIVPIDRRMDSVILVVDSSRFNRADGISQLSANIEIEVGQ